MLKVCQTHFVMKCVENGDATAGLDDAPPAEGVDGTELALACQNDNLGALFPPRRLVQFANEVDAHPSNTAKVLSACDPESVREAWRQLVCA